MRRPPLARLTLLLATLAAAGCVASARPPVRGALSKASIRGTVRAHMGEINRCYRLARERRPELGSGGRLVLHFVVDPAGAVAAARAVRVPRADRDLGTCVETAALGWRFRRPERGGIVVVTYPFQLHPTGVKTPPPAQDSVVAQRPGS